MIRLGVLDLCKRDGRTSAAQAMRDTIELAAVAERLGYERYWLAEHHTPDAACSTPETLLPLIASRTRTLRVGTGGLLLRYRSPLAVAECFHALEALFPGRIELGLCRGPGADEATARALVDGHEAALGTERYRRKVGELVDLLNGHERGGHPSLGPRSTPPPVWMLGSGLESLELARAYALPHAMAVFLGESIERARELFAWLAESGATKGTAVALSVNCAPTAELARARESRQVDAGLRPSNVVGDPAACRRQIARVADACGTGDLLVTTWCVSASERTFMLESLAAR